MPDTRTSRDDASSGQAANRSSESESQIGSGSTFLPEQAWMIETAELDVVDQENDSVILEE